MDVGSDARAVRPYMHSNGTAPDAVHGPCYARASLHAFKRSGVSATLIINDLHSAFQCQPYYRAI